MIKKTEKTDLKTETLIKKQKKLIKNRKTD